VAANIAATAGQESVVLCTIEAVRLGTKGGSEGVAAPGLPKLCDLLSEYVANQGKVWLCGACAKPRGITEAQLAPGVSIVGAAKVVEEIVAGAKTVAFA
jgi:predicted peroxiredoxin